MNKNAKIFIVLILFAAIGVIIAAKQKNGCPFQCSTQPPAPVTNSVNVNGDVKSVEANAEEVAEPTAVENKLPKLIDLGADKCIPCKMMMPILEELKTEYKNKLDVDFIDVMKEQDRAADYGIRVIPTQIFYDTEGTELFRHEGFFPKEEILAKFKELGINL
ncbi:MAG: thioredoxin family protein [Phycisphaerae bacterium]|nr:thioredoxin family protein [Phycisphaerae bacterium]